MAIPQAVLDKAKELIEYYGENFESLGVHQGKQVYKFVFPLGERTGFPYVYLYDEQTNEVEKITGINAIVFLNSF